MVSTRHNRADVIEAAGRLFAENGYHGTSMRDLGRELGLLGSSLYAHVDSKQDLLVEVVEAGALLFQQSAEAALSGAGTPAERLDALISGHVGVVLDNIDIARTFLNEARMLDAEHRGRILEARDRYEAAFRTVLAEGVKDGTFRKEVDPKVDAIFILSILNAIERWYRAEGPMDRGDLGAELIRFIGAGLRQES